MNNGKKQYKFSVLYCHCYYQEFYVLLSEQLKIKNGIMLKLQTLKVNNRSIVHFFKVYNTEC